MTETPPDEARGLKNVVYACLTAYFDAHEGDLPPPGLYDRVMREAEKALLTITLERTGGVQTDAAKLLGINRNTLRKKLDHL